MKQVLTPAGLAARAIYLENELKKIKLTRAPTPEDNLEFIKEKFAAFVLASPKDDKLHVFSKEVGKEYWLVFTGEGAETCAFLEQIAAIVKNHKEKGMVGVYALPHSWANDDGYPRDGRVAVCLDNRSVAWDKCLDALMEYTKKELPFKKPSSYVDNPSVLFQSSDAAASHASKDPLVSTFTR